MPGSAKAGEQLLQRLAPERWPLPLEALPAGAALVGGALRDALLGRLQQQPDLDLVVPGGAIALCRDLAKRLGGSAVVLDQQRDIARLVLRGWTIDLAAWEGESLEADLQRRDYSINALALPLQPMGSALLDPSGGLQDLALRQLRAISSANLRSDPLRLLRGLRLAFELDFALEAQTRRWIGELNGSLAAVASERVLAELDKLACCPNGGPGLLQVRQLGLLEPWLGPQSSLLEPLQGLSIEHAEALGLQPQEWSWALPLARMACLVDRQALIQLRSSRALQEQVHRLRTGWQLLQGRSPEALDETDRFALHCNLEAELPALALLLPAGSETRSLLARWRDPADPLAHPRPPIDGHRLQTGLQRSPGPWLGQLLKHLSQERAFGRLPAHADEAEVITAAKRWLAAAMQHEDEPAP